MAKYIVNGFPSDRIVNEIVKDVGSVRGAKILFIKPLTIEAQFSNDGDKVVKILEDNGVSYTKR
ncbi:MAG: hypothetical protein PHQ98_03330 [Candidatus ainarchaeum sp.]|nr:hypothetical protein [Candidatus ainarchaeum sp.]